MCRIHWPPQYAGEPRRVLVGVLVNKNPRTRARNVQNPMAPTVRRRFSAYASRSHPSENPKLGGGREHQAAQYARETIRQARIDTIVTSHSGTDANDVRTPPL